MPRPEVNLTPERTALVVVECQGGTVGADSALPDLAAATKIWRRMFPSEEHLAREALRFMKSRWAG